MTIQEQQVFARAVSKLLNGDSPNGVLPEDCGDWGHVLTDLYAVHTQGGTKAVRLAWDVAARKHKGLARVLAANTPAPRNKGGIPVLPDHVSAIIEHEEPCADWLNRYIDFACECAPMAPRSFHEATGLFAASVAIARRLVCKFGLDEIYPNLFILILAEPAVYKKTSSMKVMWKLFRVAGLKHLLLPQSMTPQAIFQELSTSIPTGFDGYTSEMVEYWLRERAFAAQRGWTMDEAAGLFDSMKREYNTGLDTLILQLFDCTEEINEQTMSRGRIYIRDAYLSFCGSTAPEKLRKYLNNDEHWGSGLWSRFVFITPNTPPTYQEQPDEEFHIPSDIAREFRAFYDMFPAPIAELDHIKEEGTRGKGTPTVDIYNAAPPSKVILSKDVKRAKEMYSRALYDIFSTKQVDETLNSPYDRLGLQALKVAIILAALDTHELPVHVELKHFARAMRITETWRTYLHHIWNAGTESSETHLSDRIAEHLTKNIVGRTTRELCHTFHQPAVEINKALELLTQDGIVECTQVGRRKMWVITESVASVAKCYTDVANTSPAS